MDGGERQGVSVFVSGRGTGTVDLTLFLAFLGICFPHLSSPLLYSDFAFFFFIYLSLLN